MDEQKKHRLIWIAIGVGVVVFYVIVFFAVQGVASSMKKLADETAAETYRLSDYAPSKEHTECDEAMLQTLFQDANKLLENYSIIYFDENTYVRQFISAQLDGDVSVSKGTVTIETGRKNVDDKNLEYLIVLSILTTQYADSVANMDYGYGSSENAATTSSAFVCSSYKSAGYPNAQKYYEALHKGEAVFPQGACAFAVSFVEKAITKYADPGSQNLYEGLAKG